jgi:hypothetical protein
MPYFSPIETLTFTPESYLPTAPYIPAHFLPQQKVISAESLRLELDELGQSSIINLMMDDTMLIPYVDLSKYDSETKDWFWYEASTNLPYRFNRSTNTLSNLYPSNYSGLTLYSNIVFDVDNTRLSATFKDANDNYVDFYKYSPLLLVVENAAYNDLSDYSLFLVSDRLNKKDTTLREYYYDFNSRIFTNFNLAGVSPSQIKLYYYTICDNKVQVKCRMSANAGSETFYTPRVNNYIVKLKGQSLRA